MTQQTQDQQLRRIAIGEIIRVIALALENTSEDVWNFSKLLLLRIPAIVDADGPPQPPPDRDVKEWLRLGREAERDFPGWTRLERCCRVCNCTEHSPCILSDGSACRWVEADLCSACVIETHLVHPEPHYIAPRNYTAVEHEEARELYTTACAAEPV